MPDPSDRQLLFRQCARPGCENPVPDKEPGTRGRQATYCSHNCIKRACDENHRSTCSECGATMGVRSGWWSTGKPQERCQPCHDKREAAARRARLEDVACMYREGMTYAQIGEALGYGPKSKPPEVSEAFKFGLLTDADRRYPKQRAENMREGRWGEAA